MTKKIKKVRSKAEGAPLRLSRSPLEPYRHEIEVLRAKRWSNQSIADWIESEVGIKTSECAVRNLLNKAKLQKPLPLQPVKFETTQKIQNSNEVEEPDYKKQIAKKLEERTETKGKEKRFSFSGTKVTLETEKKA